jgi:hypothetical protein
MFQLSLSINTSQHQEWEIGIIRVTVGRATCTLLKYLEEVTLIIQRY